VRRHLSCFAVALAALVAGCAGPYVARTGPLFPCDTTGEPYRAENPQGVCGWQLNRYRVLLFQMGYVPEAGPRRPSQYRLTVHHWTHVWADTADVLTVDFTYSTEGAGGRVLRINVSGRTFVESAGKQRHVRDSSSLTRDVEYLVEQLLQMFHQVTRR